MPEYFYESLNKSGKKNKGTLIATNSVDLIKKIEEKKEHVISYKKKTNKNLVNQNLFGLISFKYKLHKKYIEFFLDNIQLLLDGGYVLIDALAEIHTSTKNKKLKRIITEIISYLENGDTFYEALSNFQYTFDPFVLEAIRIGEESGTLIENLKEQVVRLKKESELASKIKSQSIYPIILFVFVLCLFIVLNLYVMPQMIENFESFAQDTSDTKTETIININKFLMDYGMALPVLMILLTFIWKALSFYKTTSYVKDIIKMKLPVLRDFILYANIVRIANCLQIGIKSGFSMLSVLNFADKSISNNVIRLQMSEVKDLIIAGDTLSEAMKENSLDSVFTSLVTIAESTGDYTHTMGKAYDYYIQKIDSQLKTLFILSNFIIILFLGIVVGFAMMSILIPMYELPTMIQ